MSNNQNLLKIGKRIREYRIRAGLSQFELEVKIGAASGSLSRIENGTVNPTKETLLKIFDVLNLSSAEGLEIFDIEVDLRNECLKRLKRTLDSCLQIDNILQFSVNILVYELDYSGSFIVMPQGSKLHSTYSTQNWASELSFRFIPQKFQSLNVEIDDPYNLMARSFKNDEICIDPDMKKYLYPAVNNLVVRMIKKISKVRSCISLPLKYNSQMLGVIFFAKSVETSFEDDIEFLQKYTDEVAKGMYRVKANLD